MTHSASESNVRQMRGPVGSGDQQHTGGVPTDSNDTNDADHKDTSDHTSLRRATAGEENDTAPLRSSQEDQTLVRKEATEERDQQEPWHGANVRNAHSTLGRPNTIWQQVIRINLEICTNPLTSRARTHTHTHTLNTPTHTPIIISFLMFINDK